MNVPPSHFAAHDTLPIGDYALIGNCRTAALVSRRGGIEWLCMPRFDAPSVFGALLDPQRGGRMLVRPRGAAAVARQYIPGTAVLETVFSNEEGEVRLTDFMPLGPGRTDFGAPRNAPALCRLIECVKGRVCMHAVCGARPGYARDKARLRRQDGAWVWTGDTQAVWIVSDTGTGVPSGDGSVLEHEFELRAGEACAWAIDHEPVASPRDLVEAVRGALRTTVQWWRSWLSQLRYSGRYRDAVERSAMTLKLMCHGASGAVVAAPTTSLPEVPGGSWNWDYRYCWVRDASMTVRALLRFGFVEEAHAFLTWLMNLAARDDGHVHVLYDVDGEHEIGEQELAHLRGYAGARPVRVGNAASSQLQLDAFGALVDAVHHFYLHGGEVSEHSGALLHALGERVCDVWRRPDNGIWESRLGVRHHTLSKAMCWLVLDRLLHMREQRGLRLPVERFRRERDAILGAIEAHGIAPAGHYSVNLDGDDVDPSLLLMAIYGVEPAGSERMMRTLRRIDERLGPPPLLDRHVVALRVHRQDEGAFGIAGFWAVQVLADAGRVREARERFEEILRTRSDVGLLGEETERGTGAVRGNFPQAFSHVGLLNAARALARAEHEEAPGEPHDPRTEGQRV